MEINQNRPVEKVNDARSHKVELDRQQYSSSRNEQQKVEQTRSDANTRLSREVDRAEISEEAHEMARRDEAKAEDE